MREERGGGSSLRKKKSQQTARAQKAPPRRALSYLGTRGRFGAVGKCEKPCKRLEACPWRVRGGVAPGASAGRLALHDLSPEATGLGAESEGGSSGPRAPRRACPSGLRGKLQPEPGKRLPAPPTSARRVGHRLEGTRASRRVGSLHPGGGGRRASHRGPSAAAGLGCGGLGQLDVH